MYEMLTGWPPFYDRNIRRMCDKILRQKLSFPDKYGISVKAKSVIAGVSLQSEEKRERRTERSELLLCDPYMSHSTPYPTPSHFT